MEKLNSFIETNNIPNFLLYGSENSNKKEIIKNFLDKLYTSEEKKNLTLAINCAEYNQGGIKFIRDDMKFFSRKTILSKIKTIVLYNADKLSHDAQSALRRCIELYVNTRFIFVVNNKNNILNPILSRLCSIFVPDIINTNCNINNNNIRYISQLFNPLLKKNVDCIKHPDIISLVEKLYEKGVSIFDLIHYLERFKKIDELYRNKLLFFIDNIRQTIFSEKTIMFIFIHYFFMRCDIKLENILFN
jgi:hypothetical protein